MKNVSLRQVRHLWPIYFLILPALALIALFAYFPAISATYHAFFQWNGDEISEYIKWDNFARALKDPVLGASFGLVMIFIAANFVTMVPSIVTAVVIHRLASERWRYLYRVAFVIPMIIPGMVWLLLWKYFYNPNVGVLNAVLDATGLMSGLQWLDVQMPMLARRITPARDAILQPLFGGIWGFGFFGLVVLGSLRGFRGLLHGWLWGIGLLAGAWGLWGPPLPDWATYHFVEGIARWGVNPAVHAKLGRMAAVLAVGLGFGQVLHNRQPWGPDVIKWTAVLILAAFAVLVVTSAVWTEPTSAFKSASPPAWLGNVNLIIPALLFWGFPWVGVLGVLLYLSGLGNIDQSVYEAADIDGCGWFRKFTHIELPLIMTQIRLTLVLMIIGTLQDWGLVFILLGDSGGPGGVAMMPGLYMFHEAFTVGEVGYACAIGLLLFVLIVYLTVINNRYVRVSK